MREIPTPDFGNDIDGVPSVPEILEKIESPYKWALQNKAGLNSVYNTTSDTTEFQQEKIPSTEPINGNFGSPITKDYLDSIINQFMSEKKVTTEDINASMYSANNISYFRPTSEADYNETRRGKPKTGQGVREQIVKDYKDPSYQVSSDYIVEFAKQCEIEKQTKKTLEQVKQLIKESERFVGFSKSYIDYILENIKEIDVDNNLFNKDYSFARIPARKIQPLIENTFRNIQQRIIAEPIFDIYNKYKDVVFVSGEKYDIENADYATLIRYLDKNRAGDDIAQSLYKNIKEKNTVDRKRVLFAKMMLFFLEKNEKIENE